MRAKAEAKAKAAEEAKLAGKGTKPEEKKELSFAE